MSSPFYPWGAMMSPMAPWSDDPGLSADPNFTTVMLRNIPNKYTTKMLLEVLDKRFRGQYDYVYLPVDFVNLCNVGYAFLNLKTPEARARFYRHFHNQKVKEVLPGFNSKKVLKQVCEVNKAKVQGAKENIRRIRQMSMLMQRLKDHPDWVPLQFDSAGNAIPLDLEAPPEPKLPQGRGSSKKSPGAASAGYGGAGSPFPMPPTSPYGAWPGDLASFASSPYNPHSAAPTPTGLLPPPSQHPLAAAAAAAAHASSNPHRGHPGAPGTPLSPYGGYAGSPPPFPYDYGLTQQMVLAGQAQHAYNVAVASATAAAVSAATSPAGEWGDQGWMGKENAPATWGGMNKSAHSKYWEGLEESYAALPTGYQFQ